MRKPFLSAANDGNLEINNIRTRHSTLSCEDKAMNLLIDQSTTEIIFVINCYDAKEVTAILEVTSPNIYLTFIWHSNISQKGYVIIYSGFCFLNWKCIVSMRSPLIAFVVICLANISKWPPLSQPNEWPLLVMNQLFGIEQVIGDKVLTSRPAARPKYDLLVNEEMMSQVLQSNITRKMDDLFIYHRSSVNTFWKLLVTN